jgi:hypothetical protein
MGAARNDVRAILFGRRRSFWIGGVEKDGRKVGKTGAKKVVRKASR